MNKKELVDCVALGAGLETEQAYRAVTAIVDSVISEMRSGGTVSIFGFGTFSRTSRAARESRNPQTGEAITIAASVGIRFAPASGFKKMINNSRIVSPHETAEAASSVRQGVSDKSQNQRKPRPPEQAPTQRKPSLGSQLARQGTDRKTRRRGPNDHLIDDPGWWQRE